MYKIFTISTDINVKKLAKKILKNEPRILKKYPFNENLVGKEDRYWAKKIIKNNKKILYDPSLEVFHHYTKEGNTWKGIG